MQSGNKLAAFRSLALVLAITKPSLNSAQTGLKVQVRTLTIDTFITEDITPLDI